MHDGIFSLCYDFCFKFRETLFRKSILAIYDCILSYAQEGISLRSHRIDLDNPKNINENFHEHVLMVFKHVPELSDYLSFGKSNAKYLFPKVKNIVINIIA